MRWVCSSSTGLRLCRWPWPPGPTPRCGCIGCELTRNWWSSATTASRSPAKRRSLFFEVRHLPGRGRPRAVQQRSEGWAAGLQMAALSIQSSPDQGTAAGRVELQRHTVAGYFLDEVLSRQRLEVADFMLATSVLDELSVPACSAVYGPASADLLPLVYSGHMFVTALNERNGTYRYHPLIKDVLQAELHRRDPVREHKLHERPLGSRPSRRGGPSGEAPPGQERPRRRLCPPQRESTARLRPQPEPG